MSWVVENKEWLFSGVGLSAFTFIFWFLSNKGRGEKGALAGSENAIKIINNNAVLTPEKESKPDVEREEKMNLDDYKNSIKILFIDDDTKFKVSKILSRSGWVHTKLIKDCEALDDQDIVSADILFIDVQGVGIYLGFNDEGLGLALAIKEKYPSKKVVIYSAETKGERFHKALREADSFLPKNADPYEFQKIVEEFTVGLSERK